jgi:DNA-binding Lrp family transcriptional regulator
LLESRTSFTDLAKLCGVSVTAVIRRYGRLKKTGIICGEQMHLNPLSVGYECLAEIGIMTDLSDKDKVLEYLSTKPAVRIRGSLGKYSTYGLLFVHKLKELSEAVQRVDFKPYVKQVDVLLFADPWNSQWHPENLVVNPSEREKITPKPTRPPIPFENVSLDETDKCIVRVLMRNSRATFKEIAKKANISINNVIQRYQFLREKNVLNLSTISVDLFKLGYNAIMDSYIKLENRGTLPEVEAQLLQIPNTIFCAKFVGGAYDLRVAVILQDFADIFRYKKQIQSIRNIKEAEFYLHELFEPWPTNMVLRDLL